MDLSTHQLRIISAFWLLGLINNVLYVIILSAALDLVGPIIPKGLVLLADVLPSFLIKLTAPYYIYVISYPVRVVAFVVLSAGGMLVIALSGGAGAHGEDGGGGVALKLFGVALASLSSGGGELSFLGLTHWYGQGSLAAWSSGTGAAGLVGAGAYVLVTGTFGLSSRSTLLIAAFLPVVMIVAFFAILPARARVGGEASGKDLGSADYVAVPEDELEPEMDGDGHAEDEDNAEDAMLRSAAVMKSDATKRHTSAWRNFMGNLRRSKGLFFPYMLPLLLVYIAEYTINQGIAPTLLFPLEDSPFKDFREFYPTYNAIYQLGVFISRSSTPFIRIHRLYTPSILQLLNLAILTCQSLLMFLPNVWLVFVVIFWEGLLGGLVYVNTFAEISDNIPVADREFSLSATTVSDSGGICIAALISMVFETALCDWQVKHGRDWCRRP